MKHYLLKTLLVICAITLGVAQGRAEMAVVKSWDFAAIGAKLTGNSVTFASMSSGTVTYDKISCELGTGDVDGLFVQGGAAWHIYKAGSLYNGNGGARLFGINNLKAGDVVTVKTDGAYFPTVTNVTSAFDADTNTYTWTVTADGAVYGKFDPRYHYIYSITVQREKSEKPFEPTGKLVAVNGPSGNARSHPEYES